ncbi:hypothetical protein HDU93_003131, partial [Gonapodya sp. JEL0774]
MQSKTLQHVRSVHKTSSHSKLVDLMAGIEQELDGLISANAANASRGQDRIASIDSPTDEPQAAGDRKVTGDSVTTGGLQRGRVSVRKAAAAFEVAAVTGKQPEDLLKANQIPSPIKAEPSIDTTPLPTIEASIPVPEPATLQKSLIGSLRRKIAERAGSGTGRIGRLAKPTSLPKVAETSTALPPAPPPPPPGVPPPPPPPVVETDANGLSEDLPVGADLKASLLQEIQRGKTLNQSSSNKAPAVVLQRGSLAAPTLSVLTDEDIAQANFEERQALFFDLLEYMETPEGSLEELTEKLNRATATAKGSIHGMIKRGWVEGFRLVDDSDITEQAESKIQSEGDEFAAIPPEEKGLTVKLPPCVVFPTREWTNKIQLEDMTRSIAANIAAEKIVTRAHIFRFDIVPISPNTPQHNLDEIILVKTDLMPAERLPFSEPEPKYDGSLQAIQDRESWQERKRLYDQGDWAQWVLMANNLSTADETVVANFAHLESTVSRMRNLSEVVRAEMDGVELPALRKAVASVPARVRELAKQLQEQSGIKIREDFVKVTPAFMRRLLRDAANESRGVKRHARRESEVKRSLMVDADEMTLGPRRLS